MRISDQVLAVLSTVEIAPVSSISNYVIVRLTDPLERSLYLKVNTVLEGLGGRWSRTYRGHLFLDIQEGIAERLEAVINAGQIVTARDLGFFPTPPWLADEVIRKADIRSKMSVLEPSAGAGDLAIRARELGAFVAALEIDKGRYATLCNLGLPFVQQVDFLNWEPNDVLAAAMLVGQGLYNRRFDRIVMNPPFSKQQDIAHVRRALTFLKKERSARLVAIMSAGVTFRLDEKSKFFRDMVSASGGSFDPIPDQAFEEVGTGVRTVMVTIPGEG